MPAVVLSTHHRIAATTTTTKSHTAGAVIIAAGNNTTVTTTTTTVYWLPVVDSPTCCCYCGGRLLFVVIGSNCNNSFGCFDACSPRNQFGTLCRCDCGVLTAAAVVLLVPYVLGPPCFRPFVLLPAFVAAANHLRHRHRIHHRLYNTAVAGIKMETR